MGCSPSKGQLFSKTSAAEEKPKEAEDPGADAGGTCPPEEPETEEEPQGERATAEDVAREDGEVTGEVLAEEVTDPPAPIEPEELTRSSNTDGELKEKRRKLRKPRSRKSSRVQSKAEFILRAQRAAHAFLKPSLSKHESLLSLLELAAHTHPSLHGAVASTLLHYEEINQALEEMAGEGEQMLREHGHYLMWPAALQDYPGGEVPPQTLLQGTTSMMALREAVTGRGDAALLELLDFFGSVSQLLGEKLEAKRGAESRLKRVLAHVEAAALRKPSPEDTALHSEDSGIGAENECERRHRGSSASSDQRLLPYQRASDDDDDDEYEDVEAESSSKPEPDGPMENTSSPEAGRPSRLATTKARRPKTADSTCQRRGHLRRGQRSHSAGALWSTAQDRGFPEGQHHQPPPEDQSRNLPEQTQSRRCSARYYGLQYGSKGPFRGKAPGSPTTFTPEPPGRNAVRRLISTFSHQRSTTTPLEQRLRRFESNSKRGSLLLPNTRGERAELLPNTRGERAELLPNTRGERAELLDMDSLPPPPPEMLMDSSFEFSADESTGRRVSTAQREAPPTTPPVSRTRLPPCTPAARRAVPSPPAPWTGSAHPPAAHHGRSASASRAFSVARAVFSRDAQSPASARTPACASTLPRPWGGPARGRLPPLHRADPGEPTPSASSATGGATPTDDVSASNSEGSESVCAEEPALLTSH